jgi:hypothetical protein
MSFLKDSKCTKRYKDASTIIIMGITLSFDIVNVVMIIDLLKRRRKKNYFLLRKKHNTLTFIKEGGSRREERLRRSAGSGRSGAW